MTRRHALASVVACAMGCSSANAAITSVQIAASTLNPLALRCLDHCVIGICVWITPFPPYKVSTTLRVRHKFPDIVVSTFEHPGQNPWVEVRPLSAIAAGASQAYGLLSRTPVLGGRHTPASNQQGNPDTKELDVRREQVRFNEAEIYGHPLAAVVGQSPIGFGVSIPGLCPVKTVPFLPYFQSGVDVMSWRNPEVELLYPGTWIPFYREVRNSTYTSIWGSVFPRHGLLAGQSDPQKASGVIAQRAADIATNSLQPHLYIPAPGSAANERTDSWQRLYPTVSFSCGPFGGGDLLSSQLNLPGAITGTDQYVYQLWRPYECCLPKAGSVLVTQLSTAAVCLTL